MKKSKKIKRNWEKPNVNKLAIKSLTLSTGGNAAAEAGGSKVPS